MYVNKDSKESILNVCCISCEYRDLSEKQISSL